MAEGGRPGARLPARDLLRRAGPLVALVLLVVYAKLRSPAFLGLENVLNVLKQCSWVGTAAMGMTLVIAAGGIDLSVGSLLALAGGLGVVVLDALIACEAIGRGEIPEMLAHAPPWLVEGIAAFGRLLGAGEGLAVGVAMLAMVLAATLAGLLHGVLVAKGRIAPFVATLGGLAAYRGLVLALADGGELRSASAELFPALGQGGIPIPGTDLNPRTAAVEPLLFPWPVVVWAAVTMVAAVVLNRTRFGRYVLAVGGNERAARYAAIDVAKVKIGAYAAVGLATGVAAVLLTSRLNAVSSSNMGALFELDVIAAVVIGGTSLRGGSGTIFGTTVGVLILATIENLLLFSHVSPHLHGFVKGVVIVLAALLQRGERTP